jgi:hypothetical protein
MSPFFDDLEDQLHAAARARTEAARAPGEPPPRRRGRAWLRAGVRGVPVAVAVGTTIVIVVAALVLLGHHAPSGSSPSAPAAKPSGGELGPFTNMSPKRMRQEMTYIGAATKTVVSTGACKVPQPGGPTIIHGTPAAATLSALGVLRRPVTAADRIGTQFGEAGSELYAGYTRRALVAGGTTYYVAAGRDEPRVGMPSSRCFALQKEALHRELPRIPASLRTQTTQLQAQLIAFDSKLAASTPVDTVCSISVGHHMDTASCGQSVAAIVHGQTPGDDNGTFNGVVPDGVASVTLRFPRAGGHPARSVTARVTNNVFAVRVGNVSLPAAEPTMVWRSADRRVIKTVTAPNAAALNPYCHKHVLKCISVQGAVETGSASSGTVTIQRASAAPKGG